MKPPPLKASLLLWAAFLFFPFTSWSIDQASPFTQAPSLIPDTLVSASHVLSADTHTVSGHPRPLYRTRGYQGSAGITNQLLILWGIETCHGYLFDAHHYLGAGIGAFSLLGSTSAVFLHTFIAYEAYILKRNSTPTAGIQIGYCSKGYDQLTQIFPHSCRMYPHIGWSWQFTPRVGLNLTLGASLYIHRLESGPILSAIPQLGLSVCF